MRPGGRFGEGFYPGRQLRGDATPLGPGATVHFPDDPALAPLLRDQEGPGARTGAEVTPELRENARRITTTYDRARAMFELAREAILSNQLIVAHQTLEQAARAALEEPNELRHDQLVIEVFYTTVPLTEALIREGKVQPTLLEPLEGRAEPLPKKLDPKSSFRLARLEWQRAEALAGAIINPTYRSEFLARVAEGISRDSSRVIGLYVRPGEGPEARTMDQTKPSPADVKEFEKVADDFLVQAIEIAARIERPMWRNYALARTAISAGESDQYERALAIGRSIENAEARAVALILVAESQCRHNQAEAATRSYQQVAEAVSRVQQDGLRKVLTGLLVDSLIATGRFTDARACLVLYPTESDRFVALGAIAEGQGRRGSPAAAREWIARDAPAEYHSALYRRVNYGMLGAISNNRQSLYMGKDARVP
jgi:hypothetical protein